MEKVTHWDLKGHYKIQYEAVSQICILCIFHIDLVARTETELKVVFDPGILLCIKFIFRAYQTRKDNFYTNPIIWRSFADIF